MSNDSRHYRVDFIEFGVTDVEALQCAKKFYQSVFGWNYQSWGEDYVDTKDSGVGTGINADPRHRVKQPLVVIYATDLEAARVNVLANSGTVTRAIVCAASAYPRHCANHARSRRY